MERNNSNNDKTTLKATFNKIVSAVRRKNLNKNKTTLEERVKNIISVEKSKAIVEYANGKKRKLGNDPKRCIRSLRRAGIKVKPYKTVYKDGYYIIPIDCSQKGEVFTTTLWEKIEENTIIVDIQRKLFRGGITVLGLVLGIGAGATVFFKDEIGDIIGRIKNNSIEFQLDGDYTKEYDFNNNEEKEFIYDMIYRLEEKQPTDENGNPTTDIIKVKNQYAEYEVWNPGHLTGNGLKLGDYRDFTEEQVATLHTTAVGNKPAANIGRDFARGVSTSGMFDFGRDAYGEIDRSKPPIYRAFGSLFQRHQHNGAESGAYGGGIECVDDPSEEIIKMVINFTAITNVVTNTTQTVPHRDVSKLPSRIRKGNAILYADPHGDPLYSSDTEKRILDGIAEQTEYYKSRGISAFDYFEYARSRKLKETQSKITSDDEKVYSNLSNQEKQNIARAFQYFKECDMGIDEIGISGIIGTILATSKGNPEYTANDGTYGVIPVNKTNLENWAKQNGKSFEDVETQLEYFYNVILQNTSYALGIDRTDGKYYSYRINYGHLKFICPQEAAYWIQVYALEQDSSDLAERMAELIYEHKEELKDMKVAFLSIEEPELLGYDSAHIVDWKDSLKQTVDVEKALKEYERKIKDEDNNISVSFEIEGGNING